MLFTTSISSTILAILSLLPFGLAVQCTLANAPVWRPVTPSTTSGGGGGNGNACDRICRTELCYQLCEGKKLKTRVIPLTCTGNEVCYQSPDDRQLFCLDGVTGAFRDEDGGKGNLIQGVYTASDGSTQTRGQDPNSSTTVSVTTVVTSVTTPASSTSTASSGSVSVSVSVSTSASQTSVPVNLPTSSAAGTTSAKPTPTSGAKRLDGRGSACGVLGLVAVAVLVV